MMCTSLQFTETSINYLGTYNGVKERMEPRRKLPQDATRRQN